MTCEVCGLDPCACAYIASLLDGGEFEWLADTVRAQRQLPFPHRAACPCPVCYSERKRAWNEWTHANGGSSHPA